MKKLIGLLIGLCQLSMAFAQIEIYPVQTHQVKKTNSSVKKKAPLTLPFFDDFASVQSGEPDSDLWINHGVYINNTLADSPPSKNVASFDAYTSLGVPYNISSTLSTGFSDTLTSQPIDLSGITPGSTDVYLSFYWQLQGLGEKPDPDDYLVLQGKNGSAEWVDLWTQDGDIAAGAFTREAIMLKDEFFHVDFQFQFVRFGRTSGFYDVWHIDYVYMNSGINSIPADLSFTDVAFTRNPNSFLSKYTAMPVVQYFVNPAQETATEITTILRNVDDADRVIDDYRFTLTETISNTVLLSSTDLIVRPNQPIVAAGGEAEFAKETISLTPTSSPMILEAKFDIGLVDETERDNDTIRTYTVLDNYYAYDDGTAEYVAGIRQRFGKIAVEYVLNQPSQITDLDICFVPFEKDLSNQTFVVSVWRRLNGREDEVLFQKSFQVKYPDEPNGFVRFPIDSSAIVSVLDTFYVGIQQTTDDLLAIGFDRNTNAQPYTYQNVKGIWEQDDKISGSLMIRPVFDLDFLSAINDPKSWEKYLKLYPNPTKNQLVIEGGNIVDIQVFSILGKRQTDYRWNKETQEVFLDDLPKGIYVIQLQNQKGEMTSRKIVKE